MEVVQLAFMNYFSGAQLGNCNVSCLFTQRSLAIHGHFFAVCKLEVWSHRSFPQKCYQCYLEFMSEEYMTLASLQKFILMKSFLSILPTEEFSIRIEFNEKSCYYDFFRKYKKKSKKCQTSTQKIMIRRIQEWSK